MAITDTLTEMTGIGAGGGGGGSAMTVLLVIFLIIILGAGTAFAAYAIVMRRQFKYQLVIFGRVDGRFTVIGKDKAKKQKLSNAGDEVLRLRKNKKVLPMPSIQTGKNTYWYYISDDGEWINFGPGDFDEDRRELGAHFLDKEMRYARTSLQEMTNQRYDQTSWWAKNAQWMIPLITFVVMGVVLFLIVKEYSAMTSGAQSAIEASKDVMEQSEKILRSMDNICSGGSGYTQEGGTASSVINSSSSGGS